MNKHNNTYISEMPHYRYKLNSNADKFYKCVIDSATPNGITLNKNWKNFENSKHDKLKIYLRDFNNPNGMIDFEEFIPITGEILNSSDYIPFNGNLESLYSYEDLLLLDKQQLINICKVYNLNYKNLTDQLIRENIFKYTKGKK